MVYTWCTRSDVGAERHLLKRVELKAAQLLLWGECVCMCNRVDGTPCRLSGCSLGEDGVHHGVDVQTVRVQVGGVGRVHGVHAPGSSHPLALPPSSPLV